MSSTQELLEPRHIAVGIFVFFAVVLLGQAASATTSQSIPDRTDEIPEYPNDPTKAPSVLSLKDDYDLSTRQAIDQMETQVAAGTADRNLPSHLREVYSGREIHHDNGARVVVSMTDQSRAEDMRNHFASYGISDIGLQIVKHTERQLTATAKAMQRRLLKSRTPSDVKVQVSRGTARGKLTVKFVDEPMNPTAKDVLSEAQSKPGMFAVSEVDHIERGGKPEACDRDGDIACDAPLRGSVWMHPPIDDSPCSAGFNVKSETDDKPYVLTTGHCDDGATDSWYAKLSNGFTKNIGPWHNSEWSTEVDSGILRVDDPSGWDFGKPWITVNPNEGGYTADDAYGISKVATYDETDPGDRVCVTAGNFPATTCGDVVDNCISGYKTECLFKVESNPDREQPGLRR